MKLWIDTSPAKTAGRQVQMRVSAVASGINQQAASRGARGVDAMRNAELEVLRGQRSGRVYRKYPFKSRYTASAPGEPPARRSGNLRLHWNGRVWSSGTCIYLVLESGEKYAGYLEKGTRKMAARPFMDKIAEKAQPEVAAIFREPYV